MVDNKRKIKNAFDNSAWMIVSKTLNILMGLTVSIFVTRYLGRERIGIMADAAAISGFFGFLASFGLLDIVITKFSLERERSAEIAATGMSIMFCGGLLAIMLSVSGAIALQVSKEVLVYVVVDSIVYLFQCLNIYEYWFYSLSKSKIYAIVQFFMHVLFMGFRLAGVSLKANLAFFIIVASLEIIVIYASSLLCYILIKSPFIGIFRFDRYLCYELLKLALPMVVMGAASTIYMKVDQIMVGKMMGDGELGLYSVAVTLAEYWYFIPTTIYSSFLPLLSERYSSKELFIRLLQRFADIMTAIGYFAIVCVSVFGHWGVDLLYGNEFFGSANILIIYIWSGLFTCISFPAHSYYIINKDTKTVMWTNIIGACLNFAFNIVLIQQFGTLGAAIATLLEYMIVTFGQMIVLRKKYGELYLVQLKAFFPFVRLFKILASMKISKEEQH